MTKPACYDAGPDLSTAAGIAANNPAQTLHTRKTAPSGRKGETVDEEP
jgi:hypothetical protein